jgi:CRP-like cAMP-binding protein
MYSICEGLVDIYSEYGTENEKKLVTLTEGQFFGEIGMIAVIPRTATAVAAEEKVVLEQIGQEDFEDYLKKHPENLQPIMSNVSGRIRELTEDLSLVAKMTKEALREREYVNNVSGWLGDSIGKLMAKLKAKKAAEREHIVIRKRQMALTSECFPLINFRAGDVIFRAGEEADCMYDICDGCVGIYSDYQTENQKLLNELYTDSVFGEMGILDNMPRSATAVCLKDCVVLVVKPEHFMQFFQTKPMKVLQILQQMCMQLRDLTNIYLRVCKTLEELPPMVENNDQEDEILARLEQNLQIQFSTSMYDIPYCRDYWYDHF